MSLPLATSFLQDLNFIKACYIVAFALFIYGLSGLTGPRTAVRGNRIAAVGMAIAIVATLLYPGFGNWGLIILGIVIGAAIGVTVGLKSVINPTAPTTLGENAPPASSGKLNWQPLVSLDDHATKLGVRLTF